MESSPDPQKVVKSAFPAQTGNMPQSGIERTGGYIFNFIKKEIQICVRKDGIMYR